MQMTILNLIKMTESSPKGYKTLLEKEKLLIMRNFSLFPRFQRLVLQTHKNQSLFGKGLTTPSKLFLVQQFSKKTLRYCPVASSLSSVPSSSWCKNFDILLYVTNHAKRDLMGIAKSIDPGQPAQSDHDQNFYYWQIFFVHVLSDNST